MQEFLIKLKEFIDSNLIESWVYEVFIIVLAVLIAAYLAKRLMTKLANQAEVSHNPWDDALVSSFA